MDDARRRLIGPRRSLGIGQRGESEQCATLTTLRAKTPDDVHERLTQGGFDAGADAVIAAALAALRAALADETEAQP